MTHHAFVELAGQLARVVVLGKSIAAFVAVPILLLAGFLDLL